MLPKGRKLLRKIFPSQKDPRFSWVGDVLRVNSYVAQPGIGLSSTTNKKAENQRFAVVISSRMNDGAVMRNRFKREVMRVIQGLLGRLNKLPYQKYVILPKEHIRTITQVRIQEDIEQFIAQCEQK